MTVERTSLSFSCADLSKDFHPLSLLLRSVDRKPTNQRYSCELHLNITISLLPILDASLCISDGVDSKFQACTSIIESTKRRCFFIINLAFLEYETQTRFHIKTVVCGVLVDSQLDACLHLRLRGTFIWMFTYGGQTAMQAWHGKVQLPLQIAHESLLPKRGYS